MRLSQPLNNIELLCGIPDMFLATVELAIQVADNATQFGVVKGIGDIFQGVYFALWEKSRTPVDNFPSCIDSVGSGTGCDQLFKSQFFRCVVSLFLFFFGLRWSLARVKQVEQRAQPTQSKGEAGEFPKRLSVPAFVPQRSLAQ